MAMSFDFPANPFPESSDRLPERMQIVSGMKIIGHPGSAARAGAEAFTIMEMSVATALIGVLVVSVYAALSSGVSSVRLARENLRATQIMLEKTESIRLYTWEQLNTPGFIPTSFIAPYDAMATDTNSARILYFGTLAITNAPITSTYASSMRQVTIRLQWTTGSLPRQREWITYVCRSGIQNYLF